MDGKNERREKLNQERIKSADGKKRYFQPAHKRLVGKELGKGGKKLFRRVRHGS